MCPVGILYGFCCSVSDEACNFYQRRLCRPESGSFTFQGAAGETLKLTNIRLFLLKKFSMNNSVSMIVRERVSSSYAC